MTLLNYVDKWCKWLIIIACIGLLLMVVVQSLLQVEEIRVLLVPVERWEGRLTPFA